ncbi:RES domain protein [Photorhabdus australis subsp. thailandensis]|uniref:RES domain protein n=2 Tax=Photorhabdus australis TaxID=286156 RepID=A0A1C0U9J1_9GAMM|nr:RES domain protein [Photorhabdus australis subsp. thailandensis]
MYGGRWNLKGVPMLYLATSISLAMLETLVHFEDGALLEEYLLLSIEIDDKEIIILDRKYLPSNWNERVIPDDTRILGSDWMSYGDSVGLIVPSVIVPQENNLLVNPQHPGFQYFLNTVTISDHSFDSRLTKRS